MEAEAQGREAAPEAIGGIGEGVDLAEDEIGGERARPFDVRLSGELLHAAVPRYGEGARDDDEHGEAKEKLHFGRERDGDAAFFGHVEIVTGVTSTRAAREWGLRTWNHRSGADHWMAV